MAKDKDKELTWDIKKDLGELTDKKHLLLIKWNDGPYRYEIRKMFKKKTGEVSIGKGIGITMEDIEILKKLVAKMTEETGKASGIDYSEVFKESDRILQEREAHKKFSEAFASKNRNRK